MTFRRMAQEWLENQGFFPDQAKEVVDDATTKAKGMEGVWDKDIAGYPEVQQRLVKIWIKPLALEWLNKNLPGAWFRPLFESAQ